MQSVRQERVLVLGGGNFGTSLAQYLVEQGHSVRIWVRRKEVADAINCTHQNPDYLKGITLDEKLTAVTELSDTEVGSATVLVLAIPTQHLRSVLVDLANMDLSNHLLVSAAKGIEIGTAKLPRDIVRDILGDDISQKETTLSGPSFAIEIAKHLPTCVTIAGSHQESVERAQQLFHSPTFRAYSSDDPISVEVAGALKNVIAIASGACDGLGNQANSRAALITRGLAEMTRIGVALGGNPITFKGLSGVGDLFLTCTSEKSRNYTVGYQLGRGMPLQSIIESLGSIAEGVHTAKSAHFLGTELGVELPIIDEVYHVLYEDRPMQEAVRSLLHRDPTREREY